MGRGSRSNIGGTSFDEWHRRNVIRRSRVRTFPHDFSLKTHIRGHESGAVPLLSRGSVIVDDPDASGESTGLRGRRVDPLRWLETVGSTTTATTTTVTAITQPAGVRTGDEVPQVTTGIPLAECDVERIGFGGVSVRCDGERHRASLRACEVDGSTGGGGRDGACVRVLPKDGGGCGSVLRFELVRGRDGD